MIVSVSQLHLSLSRCTNTQVKGDNLIRSESESLWWILCSIPDVSLGGFPSTTWQEQITAIWYKMVFIWLICWLNWFEWEHELVSVLCHVETIKPLWVLKQSIMFHEKTVEVTVLTWLNKKEIVSKIGLLRWTCFEPQIWWFKDPHRYWSKLPIERGRLSLIDNFGGCWQDSHVSQASQLSTSLKENCD